MVGIRDTITGTVEINGCMGEQDGKSRELRRVQFKCRDEV